LWLLKSVSGPEIKTHQEWTLGYEMITLSHWKQFLSPLMLASASQALDAQLDVLIVTSHRRREWCDWIRTNGAALLTLYTMYRSHIARTKRNTNRFNRDLQQVIEKPGKIRNPQHANSITWLLWTQIERPFRIVSNG
jgi:hypothetical protein